MSVISAKNDKNSNDVNLSEFDTWLRLAKPGEALIYFAGKMYFGRGKEPAANTPNIKKAREAYDRGEVELVQQLMSRKSEHYNYIAIKRRFVSRPEWGFSDQLKASA